MGAALLQLLKLDPEESARPAPRAKRPQRCRHRDSHGQHPQHRATAGPTPGRGRLLTHGPGQSEALREAQLTAMRHRNQTRGAAAAPGPAGSPTGHGLKGAWPAPVSSTRLAPERGLREVTTASNLPSPWASHAVGKVWAASRGTDGTAASHAAPGTAASPVSAGGGHGALRALPPGTATHPVPQPGVSQEALGTRAPELPAASPHGRAAPRAGATRGGTAAPGLPDPDTPRGRTDTRADRRTQGHTDGAAVPRAPRSPVPAPSYLGSRSRGSVRQRRAWAGTAEVG